MSALSSTTYQLADWPTYYAHCQDLWKEHYEEIGTLKDRKPMSPDVPYFQFLDDNGMLQILTAWQVGRMVGYCLIVVRRHTHYDVLGGFEDSYFLTQSARKGTVGIRLITNSLYHLRKRGVKEVYFMTKTFKDLGKLFERLGFSHTDQVYSKWIGD